MYHNFHIKRDGGLLCGIPLKGQDRFRFITFARAHKSNLKGCCPECAKRYFEKMAKRKEPVVIANEPNPLYHKREKPITKTIIITDQIAKNE